MVGDFSFEESSNSCIDECFVTPNFDAFAKVRTHSVCKDGGAFVVRALHRKFAAERTSGAEIVNIIALHRTLADQLYATITLGLPVVRCRMTKQQPVS